MDENGNINGTTATQFTDGTSKFLTDSTIEVKTPDFTAFQRLAPKIDVNAVKGKESPR